jgi:hypothetical protein
MEPSTNCPQFEKREKREIQISVSFHVLKHFIFFVRNRSELTVISEFHDD